MRERRSGKRTTKQSYIQQTETAPPRQTSWRRILYQHQPFPDNYIDASFLANVRTNASVEPLHYWSLVRMTIAIIQRTAVVAIFNTVFFFLLEGWLEPGVLIMYDLVLFGMGASLLFLVRTRMVQEEQQGINRLQGDADNVSVDNEDCSDHRSKLIHGHTQKHKHNFKRKDGPVSPLYYFLSIVPRVCLYGGFLLGLSPVLKTLTSTYSSDTIYAVSFMLTLLHLLSSDYSSPVPRSASVSDPLSTSLSASFLPSTKTGRQTLSPVVLSATTGTSVSSDSILSLSVSSLSSSPLSPSSYVSPCSLEPLSIPPPSPTKIPLLSPLPTPSSQSAPAAPIFSSSISIPASVSQITSPPHLLPSLSSTTSSPSSSSSSSAARLIDSSSVIRTSGTLPLCTGIFASVLLASRLPTNEHVFAFVFLAFQVYAGAPIIAFNVRAWSQRLYICITVCLLAAALFCLVFVSLLCVLLLACTSAFVSFVCPMCMMWLHGFKKNISGPWDIVGEKEGDGVREFCNQ